MTWLKKIIHSMNADERTWFSIALAAIGYFVIGSMLYVAYKLWDEKPKTPWSLRQWMIVACLWWSPWG